MRNGPRWPVKRVKKRSNRAMPAHRSKRRNRARRALGVGEPSQGARGAQRGAAFRSHPRLARRRSRCSRRPARKPRSVVSPCGSHTARHASCCGFHVCVDAQEAREVLVRYDAVMDEHYVGGDGLVPAGGGKTQSAHAVLAEDAQILCGLESRYAGRCQSGEEPKALHEILRRAQRPRHSIPSMPGNPRSSTTRSG